MIAAPSRPLLSIAVALAVLVLGPAALAATGNVRLDTPAAVEVVLTHPDGWSRTFAIAAGTTTLWDLPAGAYTLAVAGAAATPAPIAVWGGLTTRIECDPAAGLVWARKDCDDAAGAVLLLPPEVTRALPGDLETALAALDTHTRWRPGAELGSLSLDVATERREILVGQRETAGPIAISSSSLGPQSGDGLWQITPVSPLSSTGSGPRLAGTLTGLSTEGVEAGLHATLRDTRALGVPARGWVSARFSALGDAAPRAAGSGTLPHNDAELLDLVARAELGDPAAGLLRAGTGGAEPPAGRWALACDIASRGWQRNHFLEEYRENEDHAPFEETALFKGRAGLTRRFGRAASAELWLGYGRYLTWIGDGLYKKNLEAYGRPLIGGEADTLIYWPGGDDPMMPEHVFEYFGRKYTTTWTGGLDARRAVGQGTLAGLHAEHAVHTYRRYEHFSPLDTYAQELDVAYGRTLAIGYDPTGREAGDGESDPGGAQAGRASVWLRRALGDRLRFDLELGAHWLTCDDSALVSVDEPLAAGGDAQALDAGDLQAADACVDPEARLAARWNVPGGRLWAVGSRRMIDPPLEALFSPRVFLTDAATKEGVMGNPALAPEEETSLELGGAAPLTLAGRAWTTQVAAYAGWIEDAITMTGSDLGPLTGGAGDDHLIVPSYVNGGALRRYGLHLDAVTGDPRGHWWLRVAYDLSRIESDSYEAPLLDARWLDADRPQGEYESEGVAGPYGGILDALNDDNGLDAGTYRASNLDRTHQLSLALVLPRREASGYRDWFTAVTSGWTKAIVMRVESGRPFTQTYTYPAGLLPTRVDGEIELRNVPIEEAERNAERMPARLTLDLGLTRTLVIGTRTVGLRLEALNLLGIHNAEAVYRATGEADDDGCAGFPDCQAQLPAGVSAEAYSARIDDPRHSGRPFQLRAGVSVQLY